MSEVALAVSDGIAVITLDNPEIKNALSVAMAGQLVEICDAIDEDPKVAVAVICGAGGTFCSGADTRSWTSDVLSDEAFERSSAVYQAFVRFGNLETVTIAAVRGAAVGAGINLMLAADLRVVADDARLIAGFLRIGIHPGGGFFTLMGRSAGRDTAVATGVLGEQLRGRDAVQRGLAWEAVADEDVEGRALELAGRIAPDAVLARRAIASLRRELGPPAISWDAALELERGVQMWSLHRYAERKAHEAAGEAG